MRGKPFVDKRFSPAPPSKKLFSGGAAGPRRWTVGSGQRPVDRENRKRKALCLPLPVFGAYGVPCVRSAPLNGCPRYKTKTRRAECLPRFCFGRRPLCQRVVLVLAILPGDRHWGLAGVVPGSPSSCIKRVGRRMGAWGKEGPLRASRRPKAAAGRARCDEGSYGHRQQGKVPPSPKKLAYMWKKRRGGTPGIMRASASLR